MWIKKLNFVVGNQPWAHWILYQQNSLSDKRRFQHQLITSGWKQSVNYLRYWDKRSTQRLPWLWFACCLGGSVVPGMSCCPVIPIGGIPRLFIAVAQALGSDMGIVIELESIVMLQIPSARKNKGQRVDSEPILWPLKRDDGVKSRGGILLRHTLSLKAVLKSLGCHHLCCLLFINCSFNSVFVCGWRGEESTVTLLLVWHHSDFNDTVISNLFTVMFA